MKKINFILLFILITIILNSANMQKEVVTTHLNDLVYWSEKIPARFLEPVVYYAHKYNVPVHIVYGICKRESNFKYFKSLVTNKNGTTDYGVMGINSANLKSKHFMNLFSDNDVSINDAMANHWVNIQIGTKYYKYLFDKLGSHKLALLAYNGGIGRVYKNTVPPASYTYAKFVLSITFATPEPSIESLIISTNLSNISLDCTVSLIQMTEVWDRRKYVFIRVEYDYLGNIT